jgi:hypothetical protein
MKDRVTLTLDPDTVGRAKKIAHERKTTVSALVEELIRGTPISGELERDFVDTWTGKLKLRNSSGHDSRFTYLKKKYGL